MRPALNLQALCPHCGGCCSSGAKRRVTTHLVCTHPPPGGAGFRNCAASGQPLDCKRCCAASDCPSGYICATDGRDCLLGSCSLYNQCLLTKQKVCRRDGTGCTVSKVTAGPPASCSERALGCTPLQACPHVSGCLLTISCAASLPTAALQRPPGLSAWLPLPGSDGSQHVCAASAVASAQPTSAQPTSAIAIASQPPTSHTPKPTSTQPTPALATASRPTSTLTSTAQPAPSLAATALAAAALAAPAQPAASTGAGHLGPASGRCIRALHRQHHGEWPGGRCAACLRVLSWLAAPAAAEPSMAARSTNDGPSTLQAFYASSLDLPSCEGVAADTLVHVLR